MMFTGMRSFMALVVLVLNPSRYIDAVTMEEYMCGFELKCTGNRTEVGRITGSCCKPCACEDICKERDTCCSDKESVGDIEEIVKQECLPAFYTNVTRTRIDSQTYFTRSRCPNTFKNWSIRAKCESFTPNTLEDISFVSSEDGTVIYRNRFCGICNGEEKTVVWKVMIDVAWCGNHLKEVNPTATTVEKHLLEYCPIFFNAPDYLDMRSVTCVDRDKVINRCNQTEQWDVYDSKLESLCLYSPKSVYYYHELAMKGKVYGNLYCYLCNTPSNTAPRTCKRGAFGRVHDVNLHNLINQDKRKESGVLHKNMAREANRCRKDEILDTFFSTCRRLYCPLFSMPVNGQCVPFLDGNLGYRLAVRLVPHVQMKKSISLKNELRTKFISIQRRLGFGKCESCDAIMYLKKDEEELSEIILRLDLKPTDKCMVESIWSTLIRIQTSPFNIKIMLNRTTTEFNVGWINDTKLLGYVEVKGRFNTPIHCYVFTPICPRVRLTTAEHKTVLQRHTSAKELLFVQAQEDMNGTIYVCCDRYILEMPATGVKKMASAIINLIAFILAISEYTF